MEEENNNKLPFLDVLVERCDSSFLTSVYRKPTFTGLYLSWHSFAPRSRKLNLIRCLFYRALNIYCDSKIEEEFKVIKEIFINNGYPEEVIDDNIKLTVTRLKNKNKTFGPPKCPVYSRLLWVGPAIQSLTEKVASSMYRCYHAVNIRSIFTTRMAFNSTRKDKFPIFKQSLLIYKFECRCSSSYIDRTCQRLEVRIRQHVPRDIITKSQQTSGHSQAMNSAIGEYLLAINSCRTNYQDNYFITVQYYKIHLNVLEAIYMDMDHPSLCSQLSSYILDIFGEILWLDFFSPFCPFNPIYLVYTPFLTILSGD